MPPLLNIIALATFAASLSARALDPVLPHIASEFTVSIATAAGFASVFAFTFAIIQPVLGAATACTRGALISFIMSTPYLSGSPKARTTVISTRNHDASPARHYAEVWNTRIR